MRRFLKVFNWAVLLPIIAALFLFIVQDDPGYVLFSGTFPMIGAVSFEITFTGLLFAGTILFVAVYLLLRLWTHIVHLPRNIAKYGKKRQETAADKRFARAQLAMIENNPQMAEDLFIAATKHSANASLCYIGAAQAAQKLGSQNRRDHYLAAIDQTKDRENSLLARIFRAELLLEAKDYEKAQRVLESLQIDYPSHHRVLSLLAKTYQRQGLFDQLYKLMPALHRALPKADRNEVEANLYIDLIDHVGQKNDARLLKEIWNNIPKELKNDSGVVINFAEKLLYCGASDEAESVLRQSLKRHWDDLVVTAYGHLFRGNLPLQIKQAKALFKSQADSAYAALAVARLSIRAENIDDALHYIDQALAIDNKIADAYHLLAEVKVAQGDNLAAINAYREAGRLSYAKPSADLLQVEGEYFAAHPIKIDHIDGDKDKDEVIVETHSEEAIEPESKTSK